MSQLRAAVLRLALAAAGCFVAALPARAARLALVIGNDVYRLVTSLTNARNDARLMAQTLRDAGFELVGGERENLNREAMWRAVDQFKANIHKGDELVFRSATLI